MHIAIGIDVYLNVPGITYFTTSGYNWIKFGQKVIYLAKTEKKL